MSNIEGASRHNGTRTHIPKAFTDLGRLFDQDSREDYMRLPEPIARTTNCLSVVEDEDMEEMMGEEEMTEKANEFLDADDFMITETGISPIENRSTAR